MSTLTPYRPAQGVYARLGTAGAMLVLALFGSYRMFRILVGRYGAQFEVLGVGVPHAALWAGGLFLVLGVVILLLTLGPETGAQSIDSKTHALIDLLIDTEAELKKVSWPGREELIRSTTAVLVSIVVLGFYLLGVDWVISYIMRGIQVLPRL